MSNNKYYQLTAINPQGKKEIIWGSFVRAEVVQEKQDTAHSLKAEGFKSLKVESTTSPDTPSEEVYTIVSDCDFSFIHAPDFNFELTPVELVNEAINRGRVQRVSSVEHLKGLGWRSVNNKLMIIDSDLIKKWQSIANNQ